MKKVFYFWFPPLVWMLLIFWASSFHTLRASPVNWQDFIIRKLAHLFEYAVLFVLLYRGLKNTISLSLSKIYLLSFIFAFLYAVSDEFHQTLVDGRTGMVRDVLIDAIGVLFGGLFVLKISKIRHNIRQSF